MVSFTPHPTSWYADDGWIKALGTVSISSSFHFMAARVKGVPAWITPSWALETHIEASKLRDFCAQLEAASPPLIVCDLPPGLRGTWGASWHVQSRHTRWLEADGSGTFPTRPNHRTKHARTGTERGLRMEAMKNLDVLLALHQNARERKSIASDADQLRMLLAWVVASEHQSTYVVKDGTGTAIASATFLHNAGRTIYAFGGQLRSPLTGLATVMLIEQGITDAGAIGNKVFDFGGSADPGVDRFYAEFGAEKHYRERAVRVAPWAKPWLKWMRPDLFAAE